MRICGTQAHDWNHDASHSGDGQATEPIASQEDDAAGLGGFKLQVQHL